MKLEKILKTGASERQMATTVVAKLHKMAVTGTAVAAVALPLAFVSTPAQAASLNGCTVTPLAPVRVGQTPSGLPLVNFRTRVTCVKDRIVQIRDERREWDAGSGVANDYSYGKTRYLRTFATPGSIIVWTRDVVTTTEPSNEEVYHRTSFRVATINGPSRWTRFQPSPILSVDA